MSGKEIWNFSIVAPRPFLTMCLKYQILPENQQNNVGDDLLEFYTYCSPSLPTDPYYVLNDPSQTVCEC